MTRLLRAVFASILCAALLLQTRVDGIVIRHDVPDSEYRVGASAFPALAYLPGEGYGVLIARDWVVTAAHATTWRPIHELTINGVVCGVEKVIIHPGYKSAPKETPLEDAAPLMTFLAGSDDIALIKLQHAISDVTPISVYRGSDIGSGQPDMTPAALSSSLWAIYQRVGPRTFSLSGRFWTYDTSANPTGFATVTQVAVVSKDGKSYHAEGYAQFFDLNSNPLGPPTLQYDDGNRLA